MLGSRHYRGRMSEDMPLEKPTVLVTVVAADPDNGGGGLPS